MMVDIQGLTKKYGSFTALDNLTLSLDEGVVFGFVGANGAGKSTTFSILSTLLSPTAGDAFINGKSVVREPKEVRKQIGYMPDFFGVYDQLKADEYLDFYGASYGLSAAERQVLIPQLLELVNLTHKRYEYVDLLSRGMKQRLCLARSLIHDPKVLILDEPASGLDPRARVEMRDILKHLKSMGKTILISSHILPELAEMCDEIGVIDNGKLIAHGNVAQIQDQLQGDKRLVAKVMDDIDKARAFFEEDPLVSSIEVIYGKNEIAFNYRGKTNDQVNLLRKAMLAEISIYALTEEEKDLEDVFMAITKGADEV
ncbi:ABC-2 type transport system ATP-binding protein [Ureibacillus chungkukjangi]|uniref:ABC-2 type transport system ATP-binding protein n=2 Tax=Ureibacillus chungkukjangi TaxID=1202712 RepID=A0A318TB75_9BACL|nr:ABC-2 type transport system ATP-binding protein [Ureibacillus chungkukjangi]